MEAETAQEHHIEMPAAPGASERPTRDELIALTKRYSRDAKHKQQIIGQKLRSELGLGVKATQAQVTQAVLSNPDMIQRLAGGLSGQ